MQDQHGIVNARPARTLLEVRMKNVVGMDCVVAKEAIRRF